MWKKKSESVIHIWVTEGSAESIIFITFIKCCYFHYLCRPIFPTAPPYRLGYGKWCCRTFSVAVSFTDKLENFFKTCLESSFLGSSSDINFSSLGLFWAEQKQLSRSFPAPETGRNWLDLFFSFSNDCLAQDRHRGLELINFFFSNCPEVRILNMSLKLLHMSLNEMAFQNVWSVHKKSLWWNRCLLGWHVVDESEKCGHIWDTACGK
jgi:hypothetical protein